MRTLDRHKVNPVNDKLEIEVRDERGAGGAHHWYCIRAPGIEDGSNTVWVSMTFQDGPIGEFGLNGITHEALLAILIDRLEDFQGGPYACRQNALALTKLEEALMWLNDRTRERLARQVEGTSQA